MKLDGVVKGYGYVKIYDGLDLLIRRRERWCVMGINGAGKSTLLLSVAARRRPTPARWRSAAASSWRTCAARHGASSIPA